METVRERIISIYLYWILKSRREQKKSQHWKRRYPVIKAELSHIIYQQVLAENEIEKIKLENEVFRQETTELSATNDLLREQTDGLMENREKLMSDNKTLEQLQKKLQQDIEKMADSKVTLERNIHAYDEDAKWQLPEPAALMGAKAYREKNAMPLCGKAERNCKKSYNKMCQPYGSDKAVKSKGHETGRGY